MARPKREITNEEGDIILRYRWIGIGYRVIGKKIGLSHETIRKHCKENNIE